jgi:hypothetical protein
VQSDNVNARLKKPISVKKLLSRVSGASQPVAMNFGEGSKADRVEGDGRVALRTVFTTHWDQVLDPLNEIDTCITRVDRVWCSSPLWNGGFIGGGLFRTRK